MSQAVSAIPTADLQSRRATKSGFRPDIEGLRAVAVLAVVLFHAEIPGVGGGFVGVDVFFVISGFLITGMLWREASTTGTVGLRRFYGARARRLLPASALVGIVTMLGAAVLLPPLRAQTVIGDGIASALYVSNYRFALQGVDYLGSSAPPSPFQHYWSLGVEEQFYLVWPPMIIATAWLIRRRARHRADVQTTSSYSARPYLVVLSVIAVVSFALSLVITYWAQPVAFFSLPTRAWELALGGLVALTAGRWQRLSPRTAAITGWTGLAVILLACTAIDAGTPFPGTAALWPTLGAALVIGAGCALPSQGCGRLLATAPMRGIGRMSYSWYLWHWPILAVALWSFAPVMGHARWLALVAVVISGGLAALTLRYIENPLRYSPWVRQSANRSVAVGAIATAVTVCAGLVLHVPNPVGPGPAASPLTVTTASAPAGSSGDTYDTAVKQAVGQVQAAVAASVDLKAVPSNLDPSLAAALHKPLGVSSGCLLGFLAVAHPECSTGDTASTTKVALVGDSNAAMWMPGFQQLATQRHWRLETLAKATCPLLDLPFINPIQGRDYNECRRWRTEILARLQAEHPRLIALTMMRRYGAGYGWAVGFTSYETAWIDSLTRLVRQLRATGAQVLVLGPIPDPRSAVPDCLSVHLDDATACSPPRSEAVNRSGIIAETTATQAGGGRYADLTELFCTSQRCPVIVGNTLVYRDQNHITDQYARLLGPALGTLTDRALAAG